jgi:hypothetical protein
VEDAVVNITGRHWTAQTCNIYDEYNKPVLVVVTVRIRGELENWLYFELQFLIESIILVCGPLCDL